MSLKDNFNQAVKDFLKKDGMVVSKNENGDFEVSDLSEGWYTFYVQTDKRDYFTLCVYLSN